MRRIIPYAPALYILFLMLPIYWLMNMSFKTTNEILGGFSLYPNEFTLENYSAILCGLPEVFGGSAPLGCDTTWIWGYVNSLSYVTINTAISIAVALPAAYAFSRYRFLGPSKSFQESIPCE